ncbi:hypothetical protein HKCCE2091_02305 [Rhodobacterales bacterium HKCCE2091]|nr:hypothetical protein [Rhodobacterales bacterium HKCCE2091]
MLKHDAHALDDDTVTDVLSDDDPPDAGGSCRGGTGRGGAGSCRPITAARPTGLPGTAPALARNP